MERSSKRGKIPQQDWPAIIKRYEAGETLASIARTYDCSPPAISYIVSRSRARDATGEVAIESSEPRLGRSDANEAPSLDAQSEGGFGGVREEQIDAETPHPVAPLTAEPRPIEPAFATIEPTRTLDERKDPWSGPEAGAAERRDTELNDAKPATADGSGPLSLTGVPQNGGHRRTLHLSSPTDSPARSDAPNQQALQPHVSGSGERFAVSASSANRPELAQPPRQAPASSPFAPVTNGGSVRNMAEPQRVKDSSAFIDQALRERVDGDITAFLAAFDAALAQDTLENRAGLREATDRLLRAGARTRIELERLEARVPLPPRENGANAQSAWRSR